MAHVRWWAKHIGRPGVVPVNGALGIANREYVTNKDKSQVLDPDKLAPRQGRARGDARCASRRGSACAARRRLSSRLQGTNRGDPHPSEGFDHQGRQAARGAGTEGQPSAGCSTRRAAWRGAAALISPKSATTNSSSRCTKAQTGGRAGAVPHAPACAMRTVSPDTRNSRAGKRRWRAVHRNVR